MLLVSSRNCPSIQQRREPCELGQKGVHVMCVAKGSRQQTEEEPLLNESRNGSFIFG